VRVCVCVFVCVCVTICVLDRLAGVRAHVNVCVVSVVYVVIHNYIMRLCYVFLVRRFFLFIMTGLLSFIQLYFWHGCLICLTIDYSFLLLLMRRE